MSIGILVVEDNRDTLRTYIKALLRRVKIRDWDSKLISNEKKPSVEVEGADTVSIALEKLKKDPFEILVVDLKIPGSSGEEMGGLEVISESLKFDPLRPIIVITGYGTIELVKKTLTQGVFDFIEKSSNAVDDLIDSVQKALDCRNEKIIRSGNPFAPMTGIEPTVFGGRNKELEFFEQRLDRAIYSGFCEHFLVLGEWGIGKSTLLKEYKKICQSRGHLASYVALEALKPNTKLLDAARSIVEGILRTLPYSVSQFRRLLDLFDSFGINIFGTGLEFTTKKELSAQTFLHDTLLSLWKDLEGETGVFTILLDDLDNFMAVPEIVTTFKQTLLLDSIRSTKIVVGIASRLKSWNDLTSIEMHQPLSRFFLSRVELSPLTEKELRETITKSLVGTGVSFSEDIIKKVWIYTDGHPFKMQILCYHLFNNQLSRKVEDNVWEKSLHASLNDMGIVIFNSWFNKTSDKEAKILRIIADSETPKSIKEVSKVIEENKVSVSSKNTAKYLQRLVEKNLIRRTKRGFYMISDQMFREFICSTLN